MNVIEIGVTAARNALREKLELCTEPQISRFNLMYGSIDKIEFEKMRRAEEQIDATIVLNQKEKQDDRA
jgi:hypothetical protein